VREKERQTKREWFEKEKEKDIYKREAYKETREGKEWLTDERTEIGRSRQRRNKEREEEIKERQKRLEI
jgi:hypothetical protein